MEIEKKLKLEHKCSPENLRRGDKVLIVMKEMQPVFVSGRCKEGEIVKIIDINYFGGYYDIITTGGEISLRRDRLICKVI